MANIDIYNLKASDEFPLSGREEITTNLELSLNPIINSSSITGIVSSNDIPLSNAIVKLYAFDYTPFTHSTTDENGRYIISDLPFGSYLINSAKENYITSLTIPVAISNNKPTVVNISLQPNLKAVLNTLFGRVRDTITGHFLNDVTVNIYKVQDDSENLVTSTTTNTEGQYLAPYLNDGLYYVIASKVGYFSSKSANIILSDSQLSNLDLSLASNPHTNTGTVSGIIKDKSTGVPIINATVTLYRVNDSSETIVQITETNSEGRYLFGNVESGNYIVKAIYQCH